MSGNSAAESKAQLKNRFAGLLAVQPAVPPEPAEDPAQPPPADPAPRETTPPKRSRRPAARTRAPQPPEAPVPAPMPIAQRETDTGRPKRLMVPLSVDEDRALKKFRLEDDKPAAARIRAMLQLYREDERFRRRVDETMRRMT